MIYFDQLAVMAFINVLIVCGFIVLGYYYYKKYLETPIDESTVTLEDSIKDMSQFLSERITGAIKDAKIEIDMETITKHLTETFFGTFISILGVGDDYNEEWSFKTWIKEIIDGSVSNVAKDTIDQFNEILPAFADQFSKGIQEAFSGLQGQAPQGTTTSNNVQPGIQGAVQQMTGSLDPGEMIKMLVMGKIAEALGGMGGGLGGMLGGGGAVAPAGRGRSGF